MRQTYGFSHRAGNEVNSFIGLLFSLECIKYQRGVAQLVVRTASGSSQGNLPMKAVLSIVKFRGRGT